MDGQEIEIELRQTAHGIFHCGADVEQLHIQKDALAVFLFQLIGQPQSSAGQHAEANLIKGHCITQFFSQSQSGQRVRHVKRHNQTIIRHNIFLL